MKDQAKKQAEGPIRLKRIDTHLLFVLYRQVGNPERPVRVLSHRLAHLCRLLLNVELSVDLLSSRIDHCELLLVVAICPEAARPAVSAAPITHSE